MGILAFPPRSDRFKLGPGTNQHDGESKKSPVTRECYIAGWPRDADLGVIAQADGERIGAAWLRFLPAADPGYGFVAADVPELTIGVAVRWPRGGLGGHLAD